MSEIRKSAKDFIGYEYKEITADPEQLSMYLDCYRNFGWVRDENTSPEKRGRQTVVKLKRDRKIINKTELTRLQKNFEACAGEIAVLEKSKAAGAVSSAILTGLLGTAFMAGSTFAVTHEPPLVGLCVLLAVPGLLGWILPYFVYRGMVQRKTGKVNPLIEQKYDEIYEICEKGNRLII